MKKTLIICFMFAAATASFAQGPRGGGGGFGRMSVGPGGPGGRGPRQTLVTGAPYSAVEVAQTQETLADGNRITNKRQTTVYRDSQGRFRSEETVNGQTAITIVDPVAGTRYVLDTATMTARQSTVPKARAATAATTHTAPPARDGVTIVSTSLGTQSVNGVAATGTQITETIAAGLIGNAQPIQIVRITWISNDLKIPVQIKSSDPRFGTTDMELTNISTSEPSAALFVVPSGYTVKAGGGPGPTGMMRGRPGPPR